ncbi:zinc-finger domain-containing protein [Histidinibacterium aquaticum]|uniref:Zinc-finger domain-containing protein n=1 Tax=Histidinibacterium aquaticum TaxID=2613962 RepID=A0A5J5GSF9_9RHOB|nr:zinc-finger domain-containing protein [Histidinibacterium aquaticum]KAA9010518.1 zinc-finger domain-containing protein [Histidinibacterium aquaticum]
MSYPAPETKIVSTWRVACDGGQGALGHPRVWYTIPQDDGYIDCGYCDARFIHESFKDKVSEKT